MKMKIVIGIVVIIIIAVLLIVLLPKKENSKETEITKVISAGIPFRWEYEINDQDIVEFVCVLSSLMLSEHLLIIHPKIKEVVHLR